MTTMMITKKKKQKKMNENRKGINIFSYTASAYFMGVKIPTASLFSSTTQLTKYSSLISKSSCIYLCDLPLKVKEGRQDTGAASCQSGRQGGSRCRVPLKCTEVTFDSPNFLQHICAAFDAGGYEWCIRCNIFFLITGLSLV